ncbi:MAG TPA: carboxypeptidase-like regulatory domain-containing protein [Candidatus Thermoplasmatota archaeon]|nr:carboxypeptidase-like regulatory domain-containing protein [Candidatus Thermoplasmatota archaeon]
MVRSALSLSLALLMLAALVAGCADDKAAAPAATAQTATLKGVVVTQAIVPIEGATVTVTPGDLTATTDATGLFEVGPVELGSYRIAVQADGYADVTMEAQAGSAVVKVVLTNVRSDVPYIEVQKWDGYLFCTTDQNINGYNVVGAPCLGVLDIITGQQVSQDTWQFQFQVSAPGLAGVLAEMVWDEQPTGKNMGMLLRNVVGAGGGVDAGDGAGGDTDIQYGSTEGPSPLQMWVYQGIENPGANDGAAFQVPQNDTMDYKLLVLGRADDSQTVDIHLMVENHPQVFLTKFYHQIGDPSYSVLNA